MYAVYDLLAYLALTNLFILAGFVQSNQFHCRERPGLRPADSVHERNDNIGFQGKDKARAIDSEFILKYTVYIPYSLMAELLFPLIAEPHRDLSSVCLYDSKIQNTLKTNL